ncbi:MAG: carboxypeptidase-like regulatory domain-containing protein, partial [Bryobacter sp.]|nr:carboxypeptidase-like regulatory domain-containing protein [Bryobacter sp.]
MSFQRHVGVLLGILLTLGSAGLAYAQVTTGTILGTVQDPTGAPVPNAKITVTETSKNTTLAYETDGTGSYNAPFLIPGTYSVTVENAGFKKQVRPNITLRIDDKLRVDFNLQVGDVAESVTISDSVSLLKSDSAELGTVITETPVRELPLNGRNFAQLVYLSPGVTPGQSGENLSGASTFNPRGASNFNALGHQANANAWLLDGIDNNEWTFNTVIITPTIESVREFKVLTGAYSAEFGRGAGVVSVSTKSGSNDFHGNVFWFLRNASLDARPYFLAPSAKKPPFRRNQMGLAASGPLWIPKAYNGRSRTFWFFDYAGNRETRGTPYVNTVPDAQQRVGNFSQYTNTSGVLIPIYNPLTTRRNPNFNAGLPESATNPQFLRDPFAGNIIPGGVINPVGRNVASIYPLPNAAGNFNNYNSVVNRVVNDNAWTGRLDHNFGMKNSAFFRYNYNTFSLDAPQGQANCCLPTPADAASRFELGPFVAGIQNTRLTTYGAAFTDTHAFQPNLLNEFRLGFGVTNPSTFQSDFGKRSAQSLGIGGINVSEFTTGIPNINLTNYTGLSGGPAFLPVNPKQTNYQLDENIFWTAGRHTVKFGYHVVKRLPSPFTNTDTRGTLNFNNNFTNDVTQPSRQAGTGIATLLMGYTTGASRGFLLEPYYLTVWDHGTFIQDDIKVSKRLTLNVGIRWDVFTPEVEERNRITNFDYTNLRLVYAGEGGTTRQAGRRTHYGNFGPRVGMAWDFLGDGKTVLRAGYGLSYFPVQASASNIIGQQVPYTISQNVQP